MIYSYGGAPYVALGTDCFCRSDTRSALRGYYEIDRRHIAVAALDALARQERVPRGVVAQAIERYAIDADAPPPWTR